MPILNSYYQEVTVPRGAAGRLLLAAMGWKRHPSPSHDFGGATGTWKDGLAETMSPLPPSAALCIRYAVVRPAPAASARRWRSAALRPDTLHPHVVPSNLPIARRKHLQD